MRYPRTINKLNSIDNKQLDRMLRSLILNAKEQIADGREGPKKLDLESVRQLYLKGVLEIILVNGYPEYLEFRVNPDRLLDQE